MLKDNNKGTKMTLLTLFWCPHRPPLVQPIISTSAFTAEFERAIVG